MVRQRRRARGKAQRAEAVGLRTPTPIVISPRVRWVLVGVAILALVALLRAAPDILGVALGGFTLALVLSFPVRFLAMFMPRGLAILMTFFVMIGAITLALLILVPLLINQLTALIAASPQIAAWAEDRITFDILNPLQERGWLTSDPEQLFADAQNAIFARAQTLAQTLLRGLLSWATQVVNILFQAFGIIFVAVYLLIDTRKLKAAFLWAAPSAYRYDALELWGDFGNSLSRYLSGLFFVVIIQGLLTGIALSVLGVPYAILLGVWVSITSILPYIGAWLGAIPAITIAAFFTSPKTAILTALLYLAIQQLEGNVLTPRIQGDALRVHPILVFLAVIAGGQLAGLRGAIFAVPTLAVLRVLFDFFRRRLRVQDPPADVAQSALVRRSRGVLGSGAGKR